MTMRDAAEVLDEVAAGRTPDQRRVLTGALALSTWCMRHDADRDIRDAAAGLDMMATGGTLDLSEGGKARAAFLAAAVRKAASE